MKQQTTFRTVPCKSHCKKLIHMVFAVLPCWWSFFPREYRPLAWPHWPHWPQNSRAVGAGPAPEFSKLLDRTIPTQRSPFFLGNLKKQHQKASKKRLKTINLCGPGIFKHQKRIQNDQLVCTVPPGLLAHVVSEPAGPGAEVEEVVERQQRTNPNNRVLSHHKIKHTCNERICRTNLKDPRYYFAIYVCESALMELYLDLWLQICGLMPKALAIHNSWPASLISLGRYTNTFWSCLSTNVRCSKWKYRRFIFT